MGLGVRFHQTAELVLQLGKAKRDGTLETMLRDIGRADLIILDGSGYVPFDIDGARLLYQIIAGSYERRSIIFTTNIESGKWGTVFADDKTRRRDRRPHRAPRAAPRVRGPEPPRRRGPHVRQEHRRTTVKIRKMNATCLNPKKYMTKNETPT